MEDSDHKLSTRFFDELELLVQHLPVGDVLQDLHADAAVAGAEISGSETQNQAHADTTADEDAQQDSAATTVPAKRPSNPSRERKKSELVALRDQVEKLELQRTLLHLKRKRRAETQQINGTAVAIDWRKAAETEQRKRELAEAEHAHLTSVLNQQLSLSEALSSLVRRRYERDDNDDNDSNATRPKRFQSEASLGMLHAQFLHDIRRVYATRIERFFDGNAWTSTHTELGLSMIREASADSLVEEMRDTRHLPFKYERVVEAAWRCSLHPFTEQGRVIEAYGSEDDQIALKYKALTPRMADRGDLLTAVMVVKRFIEPDRTIHVWRSMLSATEEDVDALQRAYSDETGWIAIERVPEGVPGFEAGTAVVRIVAQLTPLWPSSLSEELRQKNGASETMGSQKRLQPQDFLELVVDATHDDLVALTGAIESMLLDESRVDVL